MHRGDVRSQPFAEDPGPAPRILLVAGGVDVANFAQEVAAQREYWLRAGVPDEEIACYYARPSPEGYADDRRQFDALAPALAACYPAEVALLRRHLRASAARRPPYIYLYVTTHGREQLVARAEAEALGTLADDEVDLLDQYFLQMGEDPGDGVDPGLVVAARRRGALAEDLLLTPHSLRAALAEFPAETRKIVVLQGCHSGGFVAGDPGDAGLRAARLSDLPGLTVLTAARFDRTSFGCDPGGEMTYFGLVFFSLLSTHGGRQTPLTIPWRALFGELAATIEELEARQEVRPSRPVFFESGASGGSPSPGKMSL